MRKVGIVTLHFSINYGAVLQCMALQKYLSGKGNNVEIIDYVPPYLDKYWKPWISPLSACRERLIYCGKNPIKTSVIMMKTFFETLSKNKGFFCKKRKYDCFKAFVDENIVLSKEHYDSAAMLEKDCDKYDVIFSGSDQVWNPSFTKGKIDDVYLLNFGGDKYTKATYAASAGISGDREYLEQLSKGLERIKYISAREKSFAQTLNKYATHLNVKRVIDPTLLMSGEEWKQYENCKNVPPYKYILVYCLKQHDEFSKVLSLFKEKLNLKVIDLSPVQVRNDRKDTVNKSDCGPDEFLAYIDNAEFVLTNSFHASVFSILFEKDFLTIPDDSTGSRMLDLLSDFELTERVYKNGKSIEGYLGNVNFLKARDKRNELKNEADIFLAEVGVIG